MSTGKISAVVLCYVLLFVTACSGLPPPGNDSNPPETVMPETIDRAADLRGALRRSSEIISAEMSAGASIAVISINAADSMEGEYAAEELTFLLVRLQRFRIVDRHNLDVIRNEQQFQLSGEVDDDTAVSIGHLIGAAFVITGSISSRESANYLRVRVLDVQTGQIIAMSSVSYGENS